MTAVDDPSRPTDAPLGGPPPRRRGRWRWLLLVSLALLIGAGAVTFLALVRDEPDQRSVGDALEAFREGAGAGEGAASPLRPSAGVYVAQGQGEERLSFPPLSGGYGAEVPITVGHEADGCWRLKVDVSDAHWQSWRFCPGDEPGVLFDLGGETFQRWDLGATTLDNLSTFSCDPDSILLDVTATPGTSWAERCEGGNSEVSGTTVSEGTSTFVGTEVRRIDGVDVETRHYRQERTLSGAQTGTTVTDWWFAVDTGLPVASVIEARADTDSPIGAITYTEEGSWQLRSLDART
jgi:hypothetical protein